MQYLASSLVGIGMGWVLDHWGWGAWPWVPIPFACIGALVISRLWNVRPGRHKHDSRPALTVCRGRRVVQA